MLTSCRSFVATAIYVLAGIVGCSFMPMPKRILIGSLPVIPENSRTSLQMPLWEVHISSGVRNGHFSLWRRSPRNGAASDTDIRRLLAEIFLIMFYQDLLGSFRNIIIKARQCSISQPKTSVHERESSDAVSSMMWPISVLTRGNSHHRWRRSAWQNVGGWLFFYLFPVVHFRR